jgi:alkanesulfonate monooxygenase SsuD/methylene tetrahydromethanopterin reductase-like flavin-dependent oxidoreductase (luciferase family)
MGFDHLWVQDHFLYALAQEGTYGGSAAVQPAVYQSVFAPTELLAAVAAWTDRIELGASVLVAGYHWPAQLANRLASIDAISEGRLGIVGLGVGWSHEEHQCVGVDPRTRGRRLADFVPALLACWGDDPVEYHGPFFDIPPSIMRPKPSRIPRMMSGMLSEAGMARTAALFDVWNPGSIPIPRVVEIVAGLNETRPPHKDPLTVIYRLALQSTAGKITTIDEAAQFTASAAEAGFEGVIVETNFCAGTTSSAAWLSKIEKLSPLLEAAAS